MEKKYVVINEVDPGRYAIEGQIYGTFDDISAEADTEELGALASGELSVYEIGEPLEVELKPKVVQEPTPRTQNPPGLTANNPPPRL